MSESMWIALIVAVAATIKQVIDSVTAYMISKKVEQVKEDLVEANKVVDAKLSGIHSVVQEIKAENGKGK